MTVSIFYQDNDASSQSSLGKSAVTALFGVNYASISSGYLLKSQLQLCSLLRHVPSE